MERINIYGIPNCDVTKKVLAWFKYNKIDHVFHDYKISGISRSKLEDWCKLVGWERLFNKKSTTWRSLTEKEQAGVTSQAGAIKIMITHNSIIKRPVIEIKDNILVGFDEPAYSKYFLI
ncbi:MAG: Spx/MgsR family RNA polymerase-binding regulatory protein [Ferruginibacter sp.]